MRILQVLCIALLAALLSVAFLSCSKDKEAGTIIPATETPSPVPPASNASMSILGTWSAKLYKEEKSIPDHMQFRIKEDGVFEVTDLNSKHTGTGQWIIKGNKFEASCTISEQIKSYYFKGDMNQSFDKSGGIWGYDDKSSIGGTWDMSK